MLLAVDIGNTNISIGVWNGRRWQHQWRLLTVPDRTADEYGIILTNLLREASLGDKVDRAIMSSVVPPLTSTFADAIYRYVGQVAIQLSVELDSGIQITTDYPKAVGADRIANASAAFHLYPGPSITIDMGTATKFDVVTAGGELIGGVIAPGLQLTADALAARAAQLSQVALKAPPQAIGRNTTHAVQSGLIFGYVCLIEGIVQRLRQEHPDRDRAIQILGTGGLINLIAGHTDVIDHLDPWLTLAGLRIIHERVTG